MSSSALMRSTPRATSISPSQSCTADPVALHLVLGDDLLAQSRSPTRVGSEPTTASSESASEWAGSVDRTMVSMPAAAHRRAVAAATDVLPTPPLPV